MTFTTNLYLLIGTMGTLAVLTAIFFLHSMFPSMRLPLMNKLFKQVNQSEYVARKGMEVLTPNGWARIRSIRPHDNDPANARVFLVDGYGEEYTVDATKANFYFEQDLSDFWNILVRPSRLTKWYMNVDRSNVEAKDWMADKFKDLDGSVWTALTQLQKENDVLRAQAEDAMTMAADMSNKFRAMKAEIDKADKAGMETEIRTGQRMPMQSAPRALPPEMDTGSE